MTPVTTAPQDVVERERMPRRRESAATPREGRRTLHLKLPDDTFARICSAFEAPGFWRTIGGIARDSGLTTEQVAAYIDSHPDRFTRSSMKILGRYAYRPRRA